METTTLSTSLLHELIAERPGPCVSIFLGTRPVGHGSHEDRLRLERLLMQAEHALGEHDVVDDGLRQLLGPIRDAAADAHTWEHAPCTIAFFSAPGFFAVVHGPVTGLDEAVVAERFHLRPLLRLLESSVPFYVLALSANHVRLIEHGADGAVRRLSLPDVPTSFKAWMRGGHFYADLQAHGSGRVGMGKRRFVVHGHGDRDEERLGESLKHWFGEIAKAVGRLPLDASAPRVVAATVEHAARFAHVSDDRMLLPEAVLGSPDRQSDHDLVRQALPLVAAQTGRRRDTALARWRESLTRGDASGDLRVVLPAAHQGRVRTLLLPPELELWGSFDSASGRVEIHPHRRPGDEELLEHAARETWSHGGQVLELQTAEELGTAPVAALLAS